MSNSILKLALIVVLLAALPLAAQENTDALGLEMDPAFGERSLEKIADGSAGSGESRLEPLSEPPTIYWPVALALMLAGFAVGVFMMRQKSPPGESEAPVALWRDAEKLQADLEELEGELGKQQHSNEELASDREQLLLLHADQTHELRCEKEKLERELSALRLRGGGIDAEAQEVIDQLRVEIAQLRGADDDTPGRQDLPSEHADLQALQDQLQQQQAHISELEDMLRDTHDENQILDQRVIGKEARLEALEATLLSRDEELEKSQLELRSLREKAERLGEKELHVESLDEELTVLRNEMNELLGKTGQYQALIPELENKLFHREEQIGALESDLDATGFEVVERDRENRQWEEQVRHLRESLEAAETTIASLESDLSAALEKNQLLSSDSDTDQLHQEILVLRKGLSEVQGEREQALAKLGEVDLHRKRVDDWNSTIETLQAEIRRKSTLIDSQADHMANQDQQIDQLKAEMQNLRQELVARNEETQSLRELLEQAGDVVVSLRDEIGEDEYVATRQRLAQDPRQDPFSQHEDAIDPVEADIEALRFTARSRRDLAESLQAILEEECGALDQASQRVSKRDEEVIALKNELSANRLSMVVLQSRLNELNNNVEGVAVLPPMEPQRIERELQQSIRVLESLRTDLHKWRGRVKPLHEALTSRNERINALEAEVAALREAQGLHCAVNDDELVDDVADLLDRTRRGEPAEQERARTLDEMKDQWDRIVSLESDLANTGVKLARVLELDEVRCRQIESLEMARSAQMVRFAELRAELLAHGIDPEIPASERGGNVVDLKAHRPS